MNMPKKAGIVFVIAGAVLILSALLLFLYNRSEDKKAGQQAEALLSDMQSIIAARVEEAKTAPETAPDGSPAPDSPEQVDSDATTGQAGESQTAETPFDPEMTVVEIDGNGYIGFIAIPQLALELPVMSDWSYAQLKVAPCRQLGSTKTDDLVIAAHNYKQHFGGLKDLPTGASVTFTDMDGEVSTYAVKRIETLNPTDVEEVILSGYDLVLYTCTYGGATRVVVFCDRTDGPVGYDEVSKDSK